MEKATVIALLEKYFEAGTTVAEEKVLAEYFRGQNDIDPDLAPYRDLFLYFGQEAEVNAGPGFENRILQHVGLSGSPGLHGSQGLHGPASSVRTFRLGFIAAAAAICAIVAGLFLVTPAVRQAPPVVVATTITDTYDNPEQALAAVRHALLIASTHLNESRRSITGLKN